MTHSYSQRSLVVLALLGILSGIMSVLSVILIFQLQAQQVTIKDSPTFVSTAIIAVLLPVSTVLSALSLTLNLSSVVLCLLHSYFTNEICRGTQDTLRADWFLLDSRAVRHVAVGLFCLGVSVYLAAMSIYMLLVFEIETGIAGACVLSAGVLFLLIIVIHVLIQAACSTRRFHKEHPHTPYQMDPISPSRIPTPRFTDQPRRQHSLASLHAHFSNPATVEPKQRQHYSPSNGPYGHSRDQEGYGGGGRTHRTLTNESIQGKPWTGVNSEMRSVLARKATVKDSTLV
ncbi:transmembrane protein 221 [Triplophysa dalaica]|uniref:transmembrane protein 221 n=1 Tax=Triplophysa dalaica TaxID=1582913 RepID=UPI0024DF845C|nr:transmembrane protein 221 [Triplophysa dalaica]